MLTQFNEFIIMNGYGIYVWPAYICVLSYLFIQWWLPWRRLKKYLSAKETKQ